MTSLLHQLENNEAILLMYVADELSAGDRAEVEQMLAADGSMRAQLEGLRGLKDATFGALDRLEAVSRLPVTEGIAVRRATRMMRQWQIDHALAPTPEEPLRELRFPWWSYPLTTAAAVLIAFLVWWGNRSETPVRQMAQNYEEAIVGPQDLEEWRQEMLAAELQESFEVSDEELLRMARMHEWNELVRAYSSSVERTNDL